MTQVWIHVDQRRARPWCALVRATPGGRIVTLCSELDYQVLPLSTDEPHDMCCAACIARLGSRETATAAEPEDDLAIAVSRAATIDIRGADRPAADLVLEDFR